MNSKVQTKSKKLNQTELEKLVSNSALEPFKGLEQLESHMFRQLRVLENEDKKPIKFGLDKEKTNLKALVAAYYDYIKNMILMNAEDNAKGFSVDPIGVLGVTKETPTLWMTDQKYTKFKFNYLVDEYLIQLIEQAAKQEKHIPISTHEASKLLVSTDPVVEVTLTDESKVYFDKPNNKFGMLGKDGKTYWYESTSNFATCWTKFVISFFASIFVTIRNLLSNLIFFNLDNSSKIKSNRRVVLT